MKEKKRILTVLFSVLFVVIGGTFAWLSWQSSEMAMVLTIGEIDKVRISLSPYQLNAELIPVLDYTSEPYVEVTATNNKDSAAKFNLYYYIEELGADILTYSSDIYYTVDRSTDGSTYNYYTGNNLIFGSVFPTTDIILEEEIPANTTYYYRVYLWLDGSNVDQTSLTDTQIKVELRASIDTSDDIVVDLPEGMVPVVIADNGSLVTVSEDDPDWYNYGDKKWANAILVRENYMLSRDYYLANPGTTVVTGDILAYYVYVPRYRYKIWTTGQSSSSGVQTIDIMFENANDVKSIGKSVDEYRTHPGFTFGDAELNGIWVGKFETTQGTSSNVGTSNPTILPNISSWTSQSPSAYFTTALKFAGGTLSNGIVSFAGSSTYGLTSDANSHMIKNSEWGAVAYLSHSIYGINSGIRINNYYNSGYLTGCGASTENAAQSTTCGIVYGSGVSSYPQSTTGNISGVFDMSGGGNDYTMGILANSNGEPYANSSSGFNGTLPDGTTYSSGINYPPAKYYDLYTSTTITTACNGGVCYGHALSETYNWHSDLTFNVYDTQPFYRRGGDSSNTSGSGQFAYYYGGGAATWNVTRSVIVEEKSYSESTLNGADPVLDEGMIPVTIDNDGTVRTISRNDPDWYSYADKKWANAILVEEDGTHTRDYYKTNVGVQVKEEDILAYYVWIPRYKYQIWNTSASGAGVGTETTINIVFEDKNTAKSTGTTVGSYITHPAFTFGTEELNGIWVGKFETTQGTTSNVGTSNPTILANISPWVKQNVSTHFQTSLKFAGGTVSNGTVSFAGSSTYGLASTTDSHLMKNSEWGAVAYLSRSEYGINGEIRINNYYSSGLKTGCGASTENATQSTTCGIVYGSGVSSYPQSTTGNISGLFDMSGGAFEYVMGVFANSSGSLWTGNSETANSGFTGLYGTSGTSYTGIAFPPSKYFDTYKATSGTTISATTACDGGVCYGHALSEVSRWYDDYNAFVSSSGPWFGRGGYCGDGSLAGAFNFNGNYGSVGTYYGFRSVLVV